MSDKTAKVYILDMPYNADKAYEYFIPPFLCRRVHIGVFVLVPFGVSNRKRTGIVTEVYDADGDLSDPLSPNNKKARKPLSSAMPPQCDISRELIRAALYIKETTLCSLGDAVRAMIPAGLLEYTEEFYSLGEGSYVEKNSDKIPLDILGVYGFIKKNNGAFIDNLKFRFGESVVQTLEFLESRNCVTVSSEIKEAASKIVKYARLTLNEKQLEELDSSSLPLRSENHLKILKILRENDAFLPISDILAKDSRLSRAQIQALEKKSMLIIENVTVRRNPCINVNVTEPPKYALNEEQAAALETLRELYRAPQARAALLFGITGSGKTAVMIKMIDHVIEDGKGVIALLPEIALTPQMMGIFCSYYGQRVAVIHSGLSAGERLDTYNYIKEGKADIIIGTRSAVFAPVKKLGMIIIDEEQEHTYKSDVSPKYHARDVARFRCAEADALMLLMSATPSIESYAKAVEGKYTLVRLKGRYGNAKLPTVTIADMRNESAKGNVAPLGSELVNSLCRIKENGEQAILFINRRGYHNFLSCKKCGAAVLCPSCSVSLTYHRDPDKNGYLFCHWCGHRAPVPNTCPSCGSTHLSYNGYGTQHIEEDLEKLIPDIRVLRMDTDTTNKKSSYDNILGKFRSHQADILLGTQMVTKGHDFPAVTLVGVLLADMSLYLDDYRASERTFSMLTQVIGRAGRGSMAGHAIIQTNNPDNDIIRLACRQDYETFAKNELRIRRALVFPPFCDIALLTVTGSGEKEVAVCINKIHEDIKFLNETEYAEVKLIIFGPFEAPVYRVDKKYRMRIVIKCRLTKQTRQLFSDILNKFSRSSRTSPSLSMDFNPSSL